MPEPGQLPGEYNIVVKDEYDLFDHRVPVEEFKGMLQENDVPDEVCVVGLGSVFEDDEEVTELSRLMNRSANNLETRHPLPTIQFATEGSFQRRQRDYELQTETDLYRLSRVFGQQISRRSSGWLTAPF
ncbi:hypothetical protein SAMN04487949_3506 [Halogranum gelatinilyticum]|uniref:DUF8076 domain-containing protein n=2 Tax=Halogranum gelatinilyticum TaxID=660521 RepID=A0A1G9Z1E0_9EURY|nr:hypothetical protein SAMN04487949_3506 [Halogranum gelatinilyticum]